MITLLILFYLQGIVCAITATTFVLSLVALFCSIILYCEREALTDVSKSLIRWGLIFLSVSVLTPSKDTLSVAIGLYATSEVIEAVSHNDLAKKALEAINVQLDSLVKTDAKK